ncbi:ABC transporter ATP-binding protein [Oceanicella actignis]|uniref:ATP-binding cassette, subfamily C n=1 Tax=Oceanicella actignis TaxID=1189325 RepID=A0A1M7TY30_9RHOB|nr:ABC transporter ATP-binding protein [Oceanicella actignis]SET81171.1 ATP-binding cassette, subfamily C [Oceanicella actignis]SHN75597.1 ATP-binding cassette, subfamily C [Oceanicella actignis]
MTILRFARILWTLERRRIAPALVLLALVTATEGLGLLSLGGLLAQGGLEGAAVGGPFGWLERALGAAPGFEALLALFLAAVLARAGAAYLYGELAARIMAGLMHKLRMRLYRAVAGARWPQVQGARRADLHHALTMAPNELAHGADVAMRLAVACCVALTAGALALTVEPRVVLAAAGVAGALALPMLWIDRLIARGSRDVFRRTARLYDHVARYLDNLKLDRFLARPGAQGATGSAAFEDASRRQAQMARRVRRLGLRSDLAHQAGGATALAAILWIAAHSGMTAGEGALMAVLFMRLLPRLMSAHELLQELISVAAAFAEYERQVRDFAAAAEPRGPAAALARARGPARVSVRALSHTHPGAQTPALRDVTLDLPAGTATALVGLSGAGKTTLADLMCGLMAPSAGQVLVDGAPLAESDLAAWRAQVALVSRDDFLAPDTLRANLAMGAAEADEAAMWRALELVGFAERARAMGGLDAEVGDRGDRLSAGERQRICLARAILRRPRFLALDEATSAMNPLDEARIVGRLAALRAETTILVVAHRLSSVAWVDRIAVIEEGRLAAAGPRAQMAAHGFLGRMAAAEAPAGLDEAPARRAHPGDAAEASDRRGDDASPRPAEVEAEGAAQAPGSGDAKAPDRSGDETNPRSVGGVSGEGAAQAPGSGGAEASDRPGDEANPRPAEGDAREGAPPRPGRGGAAQPSGAPDARTPPATGGGACGAPAPARAAGSSGR